MKKLSLAAITLLVSLPSFSSENESLDSVNFDREVLGGLISTSTDGSSSPKGVSIEYREYINEHLGYGVAMSYASDSYKVSQRNIYASVDVNLSSIDANVILRLPMDSFNIYGKAGLSSTRIGMDMNGKSNGYQVNQSVGDSDIGLVIGGGVSVPVNERWLIDLSYTTKSANFNVYRGVSVSTDLDSLIIQVGYKF